MIGSAQQKIIRPDLKKFYDQVGMTGSFALYDLNKNSYLHFNPAEYNNSYSPASTFKICNSLIALETGVLKDAQSVFKWDGVNRERPEWNMDQTLMTAVKNSTVWFYQECARRVGGKQMKYWLDKAKYGNGDTVGGIDQFWLTGGLRISQDQQIDFLKRLYKESLPFSKKTMDIVKEIMIVESDKNYVMRAKTGWAIDNHTNHGWYVGYLEQQKNVYFFANFIRDSTQKNANFINARKDVTYQILNELKILQIK